MRWLALLALVSLGCTKDDVISRDLGATCTSHAQCTEVCLPGPEWPNGFCTNMCMGESDCRSDATCVETEEEGKVCLFACNDDRDCDFLDGPDADWTCVDFGGGDAGMAVRACGSL